MLSGKTVSKEYKCWYKQMLYVNLPLLLHYNDLTIHLILYEELSWSWSYGSWIYNYLCNKCLSPLTLWVRILLMARYTLY